MTAWVVLAEDRSIVAASDGVVGITGWQPAALKGRPWPPFWAPDDEVERTLRAALASGEPIAVDGHVLDPHGARRPACMELIPTSAGPAVCIFTRPGDVGGVAYRDPLTGLATRALLDRDLDAALSRAVRHGRSVAVLFIDLDNFKQVNDEHGHAAGDTVLRTIAERLQASIRGHDLAVRVGGDEFVVVLTDLEEDPHATADAVVGHVRQAIATPILIGSSTLRVGASVGVACFPQQGEQAPELLAAADAGMYAAKRSRIRSTLTSREALLDRAHEAQRQAAALHESLVVTTEVTSQALRRIARRRSPPSPPAL